MQHIIFSLIRWVRIFEMIIVRRKLNKAIQKLKRILDRQIDPVTKHSLSRMIDHLSKDLAFVIEEQEMMRQAQDIDHLRELDRNRATRKLIDLYTEKGKEVGEDSEFDVHAMEMMRAWETRR